MNTLTDTKAPVLRETAKLAIGQSAVALLTVLVYFLIGRFSYTVIVGAFAGAAVTLLNFLLLASSVNRVFDDMMEKRGSAEMSEEEVAAFTEQYKAQAALKAQGSLLLRTLLLIAVPVACFLLPFADGIASLIPLLTERPVLTLSAWLSSRMGKNKNGGTEKI